MRHISSNILEMNRTQQATLIIGSLATLLAILGVTTGNDTLNYLAILLGRISGLAYVTVVDKFRKIYLLPIAILACNSVVNSPSLMFAELAVQGVLYQISAYALFSKLPRKTARTTV